MSEWLYFFPLVSALLGLVFSFAFLRLIIPRIPARKFVPHLISNIATHFSFSEELEDKLVGEEKIQVLLPRIESHIDHFLRHKLGTAMPMVGMFIGEKTIAEMKAVFMKELSEILPVVLKEYVADLKTSFNLQKFLGERFARIPEADLQAGIVVVLKPFTKRLHLAAALMGFSIGLCLLLLVAITA